MSFLTSGGYVMVPLVVFSFVAWGIIFERSLRFYSLSKGLKSFHLEAQNSILRRDFQAVGRLCQAQAELPTSRLLATALGRISDQDPDRRIKWREAVERERQLVNLELKQFLWVLGTIATAAPFVGLFGTVVGILQAFQEIAATKKAGFDVVAADISHALIATAAGILVAVVAVMAYNAFQTRWAGLVLRIRVYNEELVELLAQKWSGGQSIGV